MKYPDGYWRNCSAEADETPTTQTPWLFSTSVIFSDKWHCQGRVGQRDQWHMTKPWVTAEITHSQFWWLQLGNRVSTDTFVRRWRKIIVWCWVCSIQNYKLYIFYKFWSKARKKSFTWTHEYICQNGPRNKNEQLFWTFCRTIFILANSLQNFYFGIWNPLPEMRKKIIYQFINP